MALRKLLGRRPARPFRVVLYTKPDCDLCDRAKEVLRRVGRDLPLEVAERDISGDPGLQRCYGLRIPVLVVEGEEAFAGKVSEYRLRRYLKSLSPPS